MEGALSVEAVAVAVAAVGLALVPHAQAVIMKNREKEQGQPRRRVGTIPALCTRAGRPPRRPRRKRASLWHFKGKKSASTDVCILLSIFCRGTSILSGRMALPVLDRKDQTNGAFLLPHLARPDDMLFGESESESAPWSLDGGNVRHGTEHVRPHSRVRFVIQAYGLSIRGDQCHYHYVDTSPPPIRGGMSFTRGQIFVLLKKGKGGWVAKRTLNRYEWTDASTW